MGLTLAKLGQPCLLGFALPAEGVSLSPKGASPHPIEGLRPVKNHFDPPCKGLRPLRRGLRPPLHGACGLQDSACGLQNSACGFQNSACGFQNSACGFQNSCGFQKNACEIQNGACEFQSSACGFQNIACGLQKSAGGLRNRPNCWSFLKLKLCFVMFLYPPLFWCLVMTLNLKPFSHAPGFGRC